MRNSKEVSFEKKPISERENRLWRVSEEYILGEINVDSFEKEEHLHEENFQKANLAFGKFRKVNKFFSFVLVVFAISLIVVGLSIYLLTKNQFSLIFPAVSAVVIRLISDIHNPRGENLRSRTLESTSLEGSPPQSVYVRLQRRQK